MKLVKSLFLILFTLTISYGNKILFFDDFNDGDDIDWIKPEGGDWKVIDNEYDKSYYSESSDGHYITYVGDTSWNNYKVSVDAKTLNSSTGWAVLVVRVQDSANYYTFQIEPATDCIKFEQRTNHSYTILQQISYNLDHNQWYNLKVKVIEDSAICYINDELIFSYKGLNILKGGAGLASWHMHSVYDNFTVTDFSSCLYTLPFFDDFSDGDDNCWIKPEGGDWKVIDNEYDKSAYCQPLDGHYITFVGDTSWNNYEVSVDAKALNSSTGWAVLVVRVQDSANYYTLQIEPATDCIKFEQRTNHSYTILQQISYNLDHNQWYNLKVKVIEDSAICYIDDELIFFYKGLNIFKGRAGLASWHMHSIYDNFSVVNIIVEDSPKPRCDCNPRSALTCIPSTKPTDYCGPSSALAFIPAIWLRAFSFFRKRRKKRRLKNRKV